MIWRTCAFLSVILFPILLAAQTTYDLRFIIDRNDMAVGGTFQVRAQIKANDSTFEMGTSSITFSYNDTALAKSGFSSLNFDGFVPPSTFYSPMTTTQPFSNVISFNIVCATSTGQTVALDWMDIASITFTIGQASSTDLRWRTSMPNRTIVFDMGGREIAYGTLYDEIDIPLQMRTLLNEEAEEIPKVFELHPNYPNPFNPTTTLRFDIPVAGSGFVDTRLVIYNSLGQAIRNLYQGKSSPGIYEIQWDGRNDFGGNAPSGVYFVVFKASDFSQTRKLVLLK